MTCVGTWNESRWNYMYPCASEARDAGGKPEKVDVMGMVITSIDSVPARKSGMEPSAGLIVKTVRLGTLADLAGIVSGDIICEVNGAPVAELDDLKRILEEHEPWKLVGMLFKRIGAWRYLGLPLDDEYMGR